MSVGMQDAFPLREAVDAWRKAKDRPALYSDERFISHMQAYGTALADEAVKMIAVWVDLLAVVDPVTEEAA